MTDKNIFIDLLNKYDFKYLTIDHTNIKFHGFGLGDLLFNIIFLQNNIIETPIHLSLDFYLQNGYKNRGTNDSLIWNNDYYKSLEFKLKLLDDLCNNNNNIKKEDILFISNIDNIVYNDQFNLSLPYRLITNYKLNVQENFFNKINEDSDYIVFHTKLRLINSYNYENIKKTLGDLFSNLKIKNSSKIYILGEREFEKNYESNCHNIQTIYSEVLNLKKNNEVIDLTILEIYNTLNYENYKRDISIINKAKWNIVLGQGGHLCSSLIFGNCIFYDPLDENYFFQNMNLYNCGHRYFKRFDKFCEYLSLEL